MDAKDPATNMVDDLDERFEQMEWRIEGVEARGEARIEGAATRLDRRIDDVCDSLGRRTTESEVRLATAINHFAGTLHDVHRLLQDRFGRRKLPNN